MTAHEKRQPGQSNAEYDGRRDPNADFLGVQSLHGGGGLGGWIAGLWKWLDRRRRRDARG